MHNLKVNFLDFMPKTFFNLDEFEKEAKKKIIPIFLYRAHLYLMIN